MQYRTIGRREEKVSLFGMGCMRLPLIDNNDPTAFDRDQVIRMVHRAIDGGVNYFDTAYVYHGEASEAMLGDALADGKRKLVNVATKLPVWKVEKYEDMERFLDVQLKRLNTDVIDFYLLHALHKEAWEKVYNLGVLDFLDKMVEKGKIRKPCFSFHDEYEVFTSIIDAYPRWEMAQIQLNYLDDKYQAGLKGMRYAAERGIDTVVMEPLRGGRLAANIPQSIQGIWDRANIGRSPVEMAFRWIYNLPEVKVILSGVSNMEQLEDNIRIFQNAEANSMSDAEQKLIAEVKAAYESRIKAGCTGCEYCMPCPSNVNIPHLLSIWNDASIFEDVQNGKQRYAQQVKEGRDSSQCVECGACEAVCPQHLKIIDLLKELEADLS